MKKIEFRVNTKKNRSYAKKCVKFRKGKGNIVILMSTTTVIHVVTGTLDMPESNADKGVRATFISTTAAGSSRVAIPTPVITALNGKIGAFNTATPATRATAERTMVNALKSLMRTFQTAADDDPANAIAILNSGGFGIKILGGSSLHEFKVVNSETSGNVTLTAAGGGTRSCHIWKYSLDGVVWNWIVPTIAAKATIENLPVGKYVYFTHEVVNKNGPQGVSQVFRLLIS